MFVICYYPVWRHVCLGTCPVAHLCPWLTTRTTHNVSWACFYTYPHPAPSSPRSYTYTTHLWPYMVSKGRTIRTGEGGRVYMLFLGKLCFQHKCINNCFFHNTPRNKQLLFLHTKKKSICFIWNTFQILNLKTNNSFPTKTPDDTLCLYSFIF